MILDIWSEDVVVSWNRGTSSHHPFLDGIFPEINHPASGIPPFMETPMLKIIAHGTPKLQSEPIFRAGRLRREARPAAGGDIQKQ